MEGHLPATNEGGNAMVSPIGMQGRVICQNSDVVQDAAMLKYVTTCHDKD